MSLTILTKYWNKSSHSSDNNYIAKITHASVSVSGAGSASTGGGTKGSSASLLILPLLPKMLI